MQFFPMAMEADYLSCNGTGPLKKSGYKFMEAKISIATSLL